jgi:hypothetical protein
MRGPFRIFEQSLERMQHAHTEIVIRKTSWSIRGIGTPGLRSRCRQAKGFRDGSATVRGE